jgi:hypothetical protein
MKSRLPRLAVLTLALLLGGAFDALTAGERRDDEPGRAGIIARAQVWSRTNVPRMDIRRGPAGPGTVAPGARVACEYLDEDLAGNSPKFSCRTAGGDELKVKFGGTNGEVYGEVAATRLLWVLGFGADRMYPVRIVCSGCPREFGGTAMIAGTHLFDPAVIERKASGEELDPDGEAGWSWSELDRVDEKAGGAPKAHRDALKLLAVFLQHTDSKPQQQRLVCRVKPGEHGDCARPFMMINDVGLTFGRASWTNANDASAVNLEAWSGVPIWKGDTGCVGNLPRSLSGTLNDPIISEDGRRFLAGLLRQLTDEQLHDLFDVARFNLRPRVPESGRSGFPAIQEWVDAFKEKRRQIVERRC